MDVCCGSGRGCVGRVCVLELLFFPRSPDPSGYSLIVGVPGTSFVLRRSGGGAGLLPVLSRSANLPDLPDLLLGEAPRLKLPETLASLSSAISDQRSSLSGMSSLTSVCSLATLTRE